MAQHDLVIRGGTIVDGTGADARGGDVAIDGGMISAVGEVAGSGRREIDADGALVTPGFVDAHTHYDGQATWDSHLAPSSWHGVTTVVMGNCGVGFAPVRESDRQRLINLMEGVEDIPGTALHAGIDWSWESFDEYLDAVAARPHDVDVGVLAPHGPIRVYVMGERGADREPATGDERGEMARIVGRALDAGALGFSTSRTLNHRTTSGDPTPTLTAAAEELVAIAEEMGRRGTGIIELISDFDDIDAEFAMLEAMAERSNRPIWISINQRDRHPGQWREEMKRIEQAAQRGLPIGAQVAVRPIGLIFGWQTSLNPFLAHPMWGEVAQLEPAARIEKLRGEAFRDAFLAACRDDDPFIGGKWNRVWPLEERPDYEPPESESVAARADRSDVSPEAFAYDWMLERDGGGLLWYPVFNYAAGTLDDQRELLTHPRSVIGLGDGGAHVGTICDASFPTTLLAHWVRDRDRDSLTIEEAVRMHTRDTAAAVGLLDRGLVAPGMRADLNVIDLDRLDARRPELVRDLPADGPRLMQRADGYVATVVAGRVTYEAGEPTGELPGRLVRGARSAPRAAAPDPR